MQGLNSNINATFLKTLTNFLAVVAKAAGTFIDGKMIRCGPWILIKLRRDRSSLKCHFKKLVYESADKS